MTKNDVLPYVGRVVQVYLAVAGRSGAGFQATLLEASDTGIMLEARDMRVITPDTTLLHEGNVFLEKLRTYYGYGYLLSFVPVSQQATQTESLFVIPGWTLLLGGIALVLGTLWLANRQT
jgi:hypothetical protein